MLYLTRGDHCGDRHALDSRWSILRAHSRSVDGIGDWCDAFGDTFALGWSALDHVIDGIGDLSIVVRGRTMHVDGYSAAYSLDAPAGDCLCL